MSALPNAAAQAAAVTACTRAVLVHAVVLQRLFIRLPSSVVTLDGAGELLRPVPSTRPARALVTEFMPDADENSELLNVTPGNTCAAYDGVFTMTLQYWIASCAIPT
jgi:hypothetical protein